ncbi:hypothetical protein GCM10008935_25160 [Alkalibacillus silvisoli]|uniref:Uncharacterized protein n=1 Tax=Alkalibacillus silvisoli TaxID=392823 RepID=A0ABP3JZY3_9BACI
MYHFMLRYKEKQKGPYDIDCGHMPPQIPFVNGAYAEVRVGQGKGAIKQSFMS